MTSNRKSLTIRIFLTTALALGAIAFFLVANRKDPRPNIVLIMADDVSPDLFSCFNPFTPYGDEISAQTPNIDKFVENGLVFKTAYAAAMCLPARLTLMTGKYGTTTGAIKNRVYLEDNHRTFYNDHPPFSRFLQEAGYETAIAGKWHAGRQQPHSEEVGFDEYCLWESDQRIERETGSALKEGQVGYEDENHNMPSRYWHPCLLRNGELVDSSPEDYGPEICSEFILDFIERKAKGKKPFFAYWSTVLPHVTATLHYPSSPLKGPIGEMEGSPDDDTDERLANLVEYLDVKVGAIREKLIELGVAENTVLIFCSDNATVGEGKMQGVERGCHVAFMIEGADILRRGFTGELMDFSDIAPTLLSYGGTASPENNKLDGTNLRPFLSGESDRTKPVIQGLMSTTITLRTKSHLLEAVTPALGLPDGRLYSTGENRFWKGYELLTDEKSTDNSTESLLTHLSDHPPINPSHSFFQTPEGVRFLKAERTPRHIEAHLRNTDRYRFYDQPLPEEVGKP